MLQPEEKKGTECCFYITHLLFLSFHPFCCELSSTIDLAMH